MSGERTEKATSKRRDEARKKGQIARSVEVNSTVVLLATFAALALTGPVLWSRLSAEMTRTLDRTTVHDVDGGTIAGLGSAWLATIAGVLAPIVIAAVAAGLAANVLQNRPRITTSAVKPDLTKLNPLPGLKNLFGTQAWAELAKSLIKVAVVGTVAFLVLWPEVDRMTRLGDADAQQIASFAAGLIVRLGLTLIGIMVPIAYADLRWQRYRYEKSLKMTKQEVKEEVRQQDIPPEIKGAIRRKQRELSRQRMLAQVPSADVVVTNPTHFAVALRYGKDVAAPQVVAKGADLLARRIREIATEHEITIVENPPLARALYDQVEVGQEIPADFFAAVAEVLAYVYRTSRRALSWR